MLRLINKFLAELFHKWRDNAMANVELLIDLLESLKTKHGYKRMCEKLEKEIAKCQN